MGVLSSAISDPRHLRRFLKFEAAGSNEEAYALVAKSEGISVNSVRASIRMVEGYRSRNATSEMTLAINDLVISSVPHAKATLKGLLNATELVEKKDEKTGKTRVVREPDKVTRLEALRTLNGIVKELQPKQPLIEQHVNQTNQTATTVISAETNEDRMRRLRAKARDHNALPPEVAAVPEYIDNGEDEDDGDEDDNE